ncbi:MAG: hypothetical protein U0804_12690 [Gemmataceae bacterium]
MRYNPRGSIMRTMRLTDRETTADGAEVVRTISGAGVIVRLKPAVQGMKPGAVRRAFVRAAEALGCIPTAVEFNHGHYDAAGKAISDGAPSAYQVIGSVPDLLRLVEHFAVSGWHYAMSVPVRVNAQGAGPEKVRPSTGSAFGKPETVRGTAAQLYRDRTDRHAAAVKAGEL